MNESRIYTYDQLSQCIRDKSYRLEDKISFKTLRSAPNLTYIRNHERRVWVPVNEKAIKNFVICKNTNIDYISTSEIVYSYKYIAQIDESINHFI